jgi:hypothetical protein
MTQNENERFCAILAKAADLLHCSDSLRQECRLPDVASPAIRGAAFKAQIQLGVVVDNVSTALRYMRTSARAATSPAIDPVHDAEAFAAFADDYALRHGLRSCVVADAYMSAADVLLEGAEAAAQKAELLLRSDEKTLVRMTNDIVNSAIPPEPFRGILSSASAADFGGSDQ